MKTLNTTKAALLVLLTVANRTLATSHTRANAEEANANRHLRTGKGRTIILDREYNMKAVEPEASESGGDWRQKFERRRSWTGREVHDDSENRLMFWKKWPGLYGSREFLSSIREHKLSEESRSLESEPDDGDDELGSKTGAARGVDSREGSGGTDSKEWWRWSFNRHGNENDPAYHSYSGSEDSNWNNLDDSRDAYVSALHYHVGESAATAAAGGGTYSWPCALVGAAIGAGAAAFFMTKKYQIPDTDKDQIGDE